jgi:peptide/nickel transport system permease protein
MTKFLSKFIKHRMALISSLTLLILGSAAVFAPIVAEILNQDVNAQNIFYRYKPMASTISVSGDKKEEELEKLFERSPQLIEVISKFINPNEEFQENNEDAVYDYATAQNPQAIKGEAQGIDDFNKLLESFKRFHFLGTDELGRDVFIRLIYAGRISMGVGLMVAIFSGIISLVIGGLAGFYGGRLDGLLMRFTDLVMSIPTIPVLIVLAAIDLNKLPFLSYFISASNEGLFKVVFTLSLFSWMTGARIIRGGIHSIKRREYIMAAKGLGATDKRIFSFHIIPNIIGPFLVAETMVIAQAILIEAGLSFLGLGIQPPTPSWGNMLSNAQELVYESPHLAIFPGLMIFLVVASVNFIGDGLQDVLSSQEKGVS